MAEVGSDPLDLLEEEESSLILGGVRPEGTGLKTLTPQGDLSSQFYTER